MGTPELRRVETAGILVGFRSTGLAVIGMLLLAPLGAMAATAADPQDLDADADTDAAPATSVGDVTATATRGAREVLDVAGNVTLIERDEIDASGARSVPELLQRQPGLFFESSTTNPAGVRVESRGFTNGAGNGSSLLVQVNGRRMNSADTSVTDWSLIELDDVVRIEILRGPASALYGDNAIGGVINIITRPAPGPPRATLRSRVGRYGSYDTSLKAAGSVGPLTGSLFAAGQWVDGYRHGADFDNEEFVGSLQGDLWDRVVVGVSGGTYHDDRGFPGSLNVDELHGEDEVADLGRRAQDPESAGSGASLDSYFVEGWVDGVIRDDVTFHVQPYYRWTDGSSDAVFGSGAGITASDRSTSSLGLASELRVDVPVFGHRNRATVGFDFLRDETDRRDVISGLFDSDQRSDNSKQIHAVFVQEEFSLSDTLLLSGGVRYDHAGYDLAIRDGLNPADSGRSRPEFDIFSPKAALTWRFLPAAAVYFSYARGFRLPNFDENVPTLTGGPPVLPDLDVQKSDSFELGAKWAGERIDASAAFYWMNVRDEIIYNPLLNCFPGFGCFGQNDNFDEVRHRGVELSLAVQVLEWLSAYGNYTFDDVVVVDAAVAGLEGARMPITPRHRGTLGLLAQGPFDLELGAVATFVGERSVANDFDRQARALDSYATLDLAGAWRPSFGEHVEGALTLGVYNLTAAEYDGLAVRSVSTASRVGFYPAAKRSWSVGFVLTVKQ